MVIAKKVPGVYKSPVYVSDTQYEIWYAKPKSLGFVDKIGSYWYTLDGMKFRSSRDAMEYLIRMQEAGKELVPRTTEPVARPRRTRALPPSLVANDNMTELVTLLRRLTHTIEEGSHAPIIRPSRRDNGKEGGDPEVIQ